MMTLDNNYKMVSFEEKLGTVGIFQIKCSIDHHLAEVE